MKARKTTYEERLEIVHYVLDNDNDYKGAADKYTVPYASVYQWVAKYNERGEDGLSDKRGRPTTTKPVKELTNEKRFSLVRQEDKYETIDNFKDKPGFTVDFLCKILEIPRSSYYKWKNRVIPAKEKQDKELAQLIVEYNESYNGILGYRRMRMFINILNQTTYSIKYIHRLMKVLHIQARIRRKHSC